MSEVKEKPEEDLKVKEELDGSAVVDLPNDMKSPDEDDDPKDKVESSHEEHDDPNDSEEERREKISRRKARRIRQKHDNAEKDVKLQQLERARTGCLDVL